MNQKGAKQEERQVAPLGGGCFWCLEAVFNALDGVEEVEQITYDPSIIDHRDLLEVYFTIHDPTTLNRQGADVGTQYRSAIFYHTPEQERVTRKIIAELEEAEVWEDPIVTQVEPLEAFYPAEDYHRDYYERHKGLPYCRLVITPKMAKLRKEHLDKLRAR
ncbi:MAG: peptide-methionine (S)-S-oxide reductase MsrA [Chloroflexota bacterium]|nr:peptide-methionine (S)-S-oxide reductase MsrA [Chloroflexota bacterium]